jgi:hypothetical protein
MRPCLDALRLGVPDEKKCLHQTDVDTSSGYSAMVVEELPEGPVEGVGQGVILLAEGRGVIALVPGPTR